MEKLNRFTRKPLRGEEMLNAPELEERPTFPFARNEEPTGLSLLPDDAREDMDIQIEQVLGYLKEKLTELERFVYLIRLCDRNEVLFYKLLTSDRMRFLLSSKSLAFLSTISS
jgi:malate dehydrogenase (oxaloacetate-decarboxylating)(NADP+)